MSKNKDRLKLFKDKNISIYELPRPETKKEFKVLRKRVIKEYTKFFKKLIKGGLEKDIDSLIANGKENSSFTNTYLKSKDYLNFDIPLSGLANADTLEELCLLTFRVDLVQEQLSY